MFHCFSTPRFHFHRGYACTCEAEFTSDARTCDGGWE